ncbi:MAG: metallopeptidase TldD-related protein [Candidatus Woesearchaeota archaeon]
MTRFKTRLEDLVDMMRNELKRNIEGLRMPYYKDLAPKYISYSFVRTDELIVNSDVGSVDCKQHEHALIGTEVRVGRDDCKMMGYDYDFHGNFAEPAEGSLDVALWLMTDGAFKQAASDYLERKKGKLFLSSKKKSKELVFSVEGVHEYHEDELDIGLDAAEWCRNLAGATTLFKEHERLTDSSIELNARNTARYFINSEGSKILTNGRFYQIDMTAEGVTHHKNRKFRGDTVGVYKTMYFSDPADLPSNEELIGITRECLDTLDALLIAPVQEPLDRPAIFDQEFSAQLLYTVLASTVLNACCFSSVSEMTLPETGEKVLPDFLSVKDRPDMVTFTDRSGKTVHLNGRRKYDHQGMPCLPIDLITEGKVSGFPCTREYIKGMQEPNGHAIYGGDNVVPCMTNMVISSKNEDSGDQLVEKLLGICDEKGYDYGFFMSGVTEANIDNEENFYTLTPRLTYRIWAKEAYDEDSDTHFKRGDRQLVRGAQIVGNPDTTMTNLVSTGDDYSVTVPHEASGVSRFHQGIDSSVICPSTLVSRVELKREFYPKTRPPLLPHPSYGKNKVEDKNDDSDK